MASGVQWLTFAARADAAAAELRGAAHASVGFEGDEGDALRLRIQQDAAAGLGIAANAWRLVGDALIRYAAQLDTCQVRLRSLGVVAADQRSRAAVLQSVAMSGAPARAIEMDDELAHTARRAAAVQADHDAAVRICVRAIDAAIALAPVPTTIRGALRLTPGTVADRRTVMTTSGRLRMAATTSTQIAAVGLRGGAPAFAPTSGSGPTSKDDLEQRLYAHCMAAENDLEASAPCMGFAASAVSDVAALQLAVDMYPSVLGWPEQGFGEKGAWYRRFAVEMVAGAFGIEDCLAGDAGGCGEELGAFVIGGIVGRTLQRIARAFKGARVADEAAEVVEDLPVRVASPATVADDVVERRVTDWGRALAPTRPDQIPVPDTWIREVARKAPPEWAPPIRGRPAKDSRGRVSLRFIEQGEGRDGIRIDRGDPSSRLPSQRVDHVVVNSNGSVMDRFGNPREGVSVAGVDPLDTHIPYSEWKDWSSWNHP